MVAIKRVPQKYYLEPESSDSFRFLRAGAEETCLVASREMLTIQAISEEIDVFDILEKRYSGCDMLLMEGLRGNEVPVIEVFDSSGKNERLKLPIDQLCAIVSDRPLTLLTNDDEINIPNFDRNAIDEIVGFMEDYDE